MPALELPRFRTRRAGLLLIPTVLAILTLLAALPGAISAQVTPMPAPAIKQDMKKAKDAYREGQQAEQKQDWQAAYQAYTNAVNWAPDDRDYLLRLELVKSRLIQIKADAAERDAVTGRLDDARRELLEARYLAPTDTVIRDRLAELSAAESRSSAQSAAKAQLGGEIHLDYQSGKRRFEFRGTTQGAYEEAARQFGVRVAFDRDLASQPVRIAVDDVDFPTLMRLLGPMTGTFWRPLTRNLFLVVQDTPQKRRDYEASIVRTVLLPASETPDQMTEIQRMVREIAGITRAELDTPNRTLTLRASPQAVAVATELIDQMEEPLGEMILEIEILEVNRTYASQIGITPPQSSKVFTLNTQELQEAQQGGQSLINVINQIFGLPSSLSGLSMAQLAGLLASNQINAASLLPPLVAFGGGQSTFLATLPGAVANLSQMLSLVRHGRRLLLRVEDGQPTTFFLGQRIPVSLALFSSSLGSAGSAISTTTAANFPTTNYSTGNAPTFVTNANLRAGSTTNDLIVANSADNDVGILLGKGDGTFNAQTTYPVGTNPVWIATGNLNPNGGTDTNLDLAVANQGSNNISILLGNGDGTFTAGTTLTAGSSPTSVVAANFHDAIAGSSIDLAVANQGDNSISLFQGNGEGTFKAPTLLQLPSGFFPTALAAADFNKDGHIDLAVADKGNNTVSIFLGNGDGTFQPRTDYAVGSSPVWISPADLSGDGILDLAVAANGATNTSDTGNVVSILLGQTGSNGTATGTFAAGSQRDFPAGNGPVSIAVGDYNVDGVADLAVADQGDNAVSILLGLGSGLFSPNFELPVGTGPLSITTGVFNTDNLPDVATANNGSNNVSVILNSSSFSGSSGGLPGSLYPGAEYLDIGLKVKATPRIHLNDDTTLQLAFDISSLAAQNFNTIPVINNQTIDQTVRLKENETSVLAGIMEPQVTNAITGSPGIADLPGIGLLDQNRSVQKSDTELVILVTPRVVRYTEHKARPIYAGTGSLDTAGGAPPAAPPPPPTPNQPAGTAAPAPNANQPPGPGGQPPPAAGPPPLNAPQQR